jgi:NADPH2:quinone reductase
LEVAGTICEIGPDVRGLAVGQRVAAFTRGGGLAEVAVADAALTAPVPDGVAMPIAAAAPLALSTALLLLSHVARIHPGESVLMHSASGGVGRAVSQLARELNSGLRIGTVGRPDKLEAARHAGWDVAAVRDDDLVSSVLTVAPGGVDVILDPSGTDQLELDLEMIAPGGRIVLFGNPSGGQPAPLPPLGRLIGGNVAIAGLSMSRLTATTPERPAAALVAVLDLVAAGRLHFDVTELSSLGQVAAAHQALAEGRGHHKYVVAVTGRPRGSTTRD